MKRVSILYNIAFIALILLYTGCEPAENSPEPTPEPDTNHFFSFENIDADNTSLSLDITVEKSDVEYIVFMSEKSYFADNGIDTERALLDDDYIYFSKMAEQYNMSVYEFLKNIGWLISGDKLGYKGIYLNPGTEYIIYCYGVKFDGEYYDVITDVEYCIIKTTAPELQEITFDIECEVDGNNTSISITPNNYNGLYYAYIFAEGDSCYVAPDGTLDERHIAKICNRAYGEFSQLIDNEGIAPTEFCLQGEISVEQRLQPETNYMIAVFAVSDEMLPLLCSTPSLAHFTTGLPNLSDMNIDLAVTDITPYTAQLTITPSTNEPYAAILISGNDLKMLPEDEIECMHTIIEFFQPAIFRGVFSETMMPLMPETEYAIVAFGCEEEQPTSHLFTKVFVSEAATLGDIYIEDIVIHKVFDIGEIAAIDSRYEPYIEECECLVYVEAFTNAPCDKIYYWWYDGFMRVEYPEEAFLEDLLMYGYTPSQEIMGLWYGDEFFFAGIAEDDNGNLSEIFFGDSFVLTPDQCSPAEEFFELNSKTSHTQHALATHSIVYRSEGISNNR